MKKINVFSLKNKVVLITGAAGLLGEKHSEVVAKFGGNLVLIDLNIDKLKKIKNNLKKKYNVSISVYRVDITNEKEIYNNSKAIFRKYGKLDGLVNNAANNPKVEIDSKNNFSRLEVFSVEQWNKDLAVGLTGSFLCIKYYGDLISRNKTGGSIVNISSDLGLIAPDQRLYSNEEEDVSKRDVKPVTYSVIKSGIIGLTKYTSTYWNNNNVRCNAMCPGGVINNQSKDFLEKVSHRIPMGRLAYADEYQGTLIWLLSDASSYLNGAIIPVDGGRTAW